VHSHQHHKVLIEMSTGTYVARILLGITPGERSPNISKMHLGKLDLARCPALNLEQCWAGDKNSYATFFPAFFPALIFARRARSAAAIFLRADAASRVQSPSLPSLAAIHCEPLPIALSAPC
jgi:hypothetical protein